MPSANESELQVKTREGKIFSPVRQKWLEETPEDRQADLLRRKYAELQKTIDPTEKGSRLWQLANKCIY